MCDCTIIIQTEFDNHSDLQSELCSQVKETDFKTALIACTQTWGCLTPSESSVLIFIINRTIRFKKIKERIPTRHFLEGIYERDSAELFQASCGIKSHTTIKKAIDNLVEKSLIEVEEYPSGNYYTINRLVLRIGCLACRSHRSEKPISEYAHSLYY